MNLVNKKLLACTVLSISMAAQAQQNGKWSNDFSNPTETFRTVGQGSCSSRDGVFRSQGSYALFGTSEMKDYAFSFRAPLRKMPSKYKFGQVSAPATVSTATWWASREDCKTIFI